MADKEKTVNMDVKSSILLLSKKQKHIVLDTDEKVKKYLDD